MKFEFRICAIPAVATAFCVFTPGSAFGDAGTWLDIFTRSVQSCSSCHDVSQSEERHGGLDPNPATDSHGSEGAWYTALNKSRPSNDAARASGKLLIHPGIPWNSFLLDKMSGQLKSGEGLAMRSRSFGVLAGADSPAEMRFCPGLLDEAYNWILEGAPAKGGEGAYFVPGDLVPFGVHCHRDPEPMDPIPEPANGIVLTSPAFTLNEPDTEGSQTVILDVGNEAAILVGRIHVRASSGTDYVSVSRVGDEAPLIVARNQIDRSAPFFPYIPGRGSVHVVNQSVELPSGVAIRLPANARLLVHHLQRNDYWLRPGNESNPHRDQNPDNALYFNQSVGRTQIVLETVDSADHFAEPFTDSIGTTSLLAAPKSSTVSGGALPVIAPNGLMFGVWTDQRAVAATVEGTNAPNNVLVDVTRGYIRAAGNAAGDLLAYECVHANGVTDNVSTPGALQTLGTPSPPGLHDYLGNVRQISRPQRFGCSDTDVPPPGLVGEPAALCTTSTVEENDCGPVEGPTMCVAANLVGGDGVDDGRCALIGLAW